MLPPLSLGTSIPLQFCKVKYDEVRILSGVNSTPNRAGLCPKTFCRKGKPVGGGQRLTRLLVMTNGQWTNVHTEISPKMPDSLLLSQGGADSQLWDYEFSFCSFFMCDLVQLPHCWNFTFGCTALSECSRLR